MNAIIKFRPLERTTWALMTQVFEAEGGDPVEAYSRLLSAAMMAGAMLDMKPDDVKSHCATFYPNALAAIAGRPDIFEEMTKQ